MTENVLYKPPYNVRVYSDGMSKDHKQSFLSSCVAVTSLLLYTGWLHILLGLLAFCWLRPVLVVFVLLFSTVALPAKPVLWPAFCNLWVFKTWREYFHFSYLFEQELDKNKRYIFVECPHGVFPLGPLIAGTLCTQMFPGFDIYSMAASSVFSIPFWRHFVTWIGSVPATSANFKKMLNKGSVAVIVGGIAEMYMQHPKQEEVMLKDRKGFVRIALEHGCDGIVPVYHFGNTQVLDIYPKSMSKISRKLRAAAGFLYGRFGLPLPRRHPIFMATGKAIPVEKMSKDNMDTFNKRVDEIHTQVVQAMQDLYDRHKAEFGWADRPLVIH